MRAKQKEISDELTRLSTADEEYCITSEYLLQLANRAYELFLSSEAEEKRLRFLMFYQVYFWGGHAATAGARYRHY